MKLNDILRMGKLIGFANFDSLGRAYWTSLSNQPGHFVTRVPIFFMEGLNEADRPHKSYTKNHGNFDICTGTYGLYRSDMGIAIRKEACERIKTWPNFQGIEE